MADPFKPTDGVPPVLTAGAFWTWRVRHPGVDAAAVGASWTFAREDGTGEPITFAATDDGGGGHLVEVPAATTAGLAPGRWRWSVTLTRLADGATVPGVSGAVEVLPAPSTLTDRRSANRRILEAITATLEGRATSDAESLTVNGRSIAKTPLEVLANLRARYARLVAAEERGGSVIRHRVTLR